MNGLSNRTSSDDLDFYPNIIKVYIRKILNKKNRVKSINFCKQLVYGYFNFTNGWNTSKLTAAIITLNCYKSDMRLFDVEFRKKSIIFCNKGILRYMQISRYSTYDLYFGGCRSVRESDGKYTKSKMPKNHKLNFTEEDWPKRMERVFTSMYGIKCKRCW